MITPGDLTSSNFETESPKLLNRMVLFADFGISIIQIREKKLPARLLFELGSQAAVLLESANTVLLVNERFDVAIACGADGVHLTSTSLPVFHVRRSVPAGFTIGVSTHSGSEVLRAAEAGADFAVYGPVFATPGKQAYGEPKGLARLRSVVERAGGFPVLALGGIEESNYRAAIEAGASGIAAIRMFADPDVAARVLDMPPASQKAKR